jgi:hypothetical protein
VSLRLEEMDETDPRSISRAARYIQQLSEASARQVETYFEERNQAQTE